MRLFLLIVVVMFFLGLRVISKGKKDMEKFKEYEFNHRSSGGIVSFASYEEAKQFNKDKKKVQSRLGLGGLMLVFSLVSALIIFMVSFR